MSRVHLLTPATVSDDVLGALSLLGHSIRTSPLEPASVLLTDDADLVVVDGCRDLVRARALCQLLAEASGAPVLVVVTEGGFAAVGVDWGATDVVLTSAGPAEVAARIRLATEAVRPGGAGDVEQIESGDLRIDAGGYTARLRGEALDLTYKEFELLKYLSQHPGRVFSRAQLLQEVWGYDYYGGTRTVDVHVRRLRAKLGPEHDQMIGTVRNVGYRFDGPAPL